MIEREDGFSLVELMITMIVFVFISYAAAQVFTGLLTQFKQQSKVAETNTEGIVGLEILRKDLENAGYGLPWDLGGAVYQEATVESLTPWVDRDFNDGPPNNPARGTDPGDPASNPPAGIRSHDSYGLNNSDVFVIKAVNIANLTNNGRNDACSRWSLLRNVAPLVTTWTPAGENLGANDRVIVISPATRKLIAGGSSFAISPSSYQASQTRYSGAPSVTNIAAPFIPTTVPDIETARIVYGIDSNTDLRMPFNRADYYVRIPSTSDTPSSCSTSPVRMDMPRRCAANTGVLFKAVLKQSDGTHCEMPLLDCVADMQVVYGLDTDADGIVDTYSSAEIIASFTAQQIRSQVKEVRVFILAHEGQIDRNFTFTNFTAGACATCVRVGEPAGTGHDNFNLSTLTPGNNDYLHYRWRIYTIVVKPANLGGT